MSDGIRFEMLKHLESGADRRSGARPGYHASPKSSAPFDSWDPRLMQSAGFKSMGPGCRSPTSIMCSNGDLPVTSILTARGVLAENTMTDG